MINPYEPNLDRIDSEEQMRRQRDEQLRQEQEMMHRIKQAGVMFAQEPETLRRLHFLPVIEPEGLAVIIAKLLRQPLDIRFRDRLLLEELFLRAFYALQTRRDAHHPRCSGRVVDFDDFQN